MGWRCDHIGGRINPAIHPAITRVEQIQFAQKRMPGVVFQTRDAFANAHHWSGRNRKLSVSAFTTANLSSNRARRYASFPFLEVNAKSTELGFYTVSVQTCRQFNPDTCRTLRAAVAILEYRDEPRPAEDPF